MPFISRQESFICEHCSIRVEPILHGSCRNHCPACLYSKHVDEQGPGDRASSCGGLMEPVSLDHDGKKGFVIVHRCVTCGLERRNKVAEDDEVVGMGGNGFRE